MKFNCFVPPPYCWPGVGAVKKGQNGASTRGGVNNRACYFFHGLRVKPLYCIYFFWIKAYKYSLKKTAVREGW